MHNIVDGYYYLFFRLWRWHRRYFGESDLPHLNAVLHLGMLLLLNLMTLALLIKWATSYNVVSWNRTEAIIAAILVGLIQYGLFFYQKRYKKLIERFQGENVDVSRTVNLISHAYPVITFVGLLIAGILAWGIDRS